MPIILNFSSTTGKMGVWYQKQTKSKLNTHRQDYFYLVFGFWFVFLVCLFWSAFLFFLVAKSKKIVWRLLLNLIIFKSKGNGIYYLLSEKKEG
jgi:hypothetical protein